MKFCPTCNKKWSSGKFCEDCGNLLQDEVKELVCPICKTKLNADARFCPECGAKVEQENNSIAENANDKSNTNLCTKINHDISSPDGNEFWCPDRSRYCRGTDFSCTCYTTEKSEVNVKFQESKWEDGEREFEEAFDLMYSENADEADFPRAFELFKESAEKGYGESYYFLANCYDLGKGCERNDGYAVYWFKKAVEYDDDPYTAALLGVKYLFGRGITKDEHKAFQLFKKSAAKNNEDGQFWLGWCSINGAGCEVNEKRAYQNFHLAVKNDCGSRAKIWLAKCYERGWGCEQNSKKAFEFYKQSAEEGNADGRFQVGLCFLYGFGCDKDEDYGNQLIREAAEEGSDDAQEFIDEAKSNTPKSNKGTIGGAATGAAIGTAILPGVGTVIGGVLGGLFGNKVIDES